jgi:hypothetical protein
MAKLLSITECARIHGVGRSTIHSAIRRTALPAERVGHAWTITEEACRVYQPMRDPAARGVWAAEVRWGQRRAARSAAGDDDRPCGQLEAEDG